MAKAYERIEWLFLKEILVRMGFPERRVNVSEACVEHCTFSFQVNGIPTEFFSSSQGLQQGDPLSPSLFVLAADYLSHSIDAFICENPRMTYNTSGNGLSISHLPYMDDIIFFTREDNDGLLELMHLLEHYGSVTSLLVSMQKSTSFYPLSLWIGAQWVHVHTGFARGDLLVIYHGIPLYKGHLTSALFAKVKQRMSRKEKIEHCIR